MYFSSIIHVLGGLAIFLFGMEFMSGALQRVAGDRMQSILSKATNNRILGVLTGLFVTSIIQSSSATTVMMVGFVNAGLLNIQQATGIIMGANIGTTMTGWLVSLLGFKVKISSFAFPAITLGFLLRFFKKENVKYIGELMIGFGLLFLGLDFMKEGLPHIKDSPEMAEWLHHYHASGYLSALVVIGVGTIITMIVQSSSAVMAVTLTAAANGLIDLNTSAALILGENIGTTITALLASIGANRNALRAASIHSMFNIFGVLWVWILFFPAVSFIEYIVPGNASNPINIPHHLAMFHTLFNVTNTCVAIFFANFFVKCAYIFVPKRKEKISIKGPLLEVTPMTIPGMAIGEVYRETKRMIINLMEMFDDAMKVVIESPVKSKTLVRRIQKREEEIDMMETQIHDFLSQMMRQKISLRLEGEVTILMQIVTDIEHMGDHCERIALLAQKRHDKRLVLSDIAINEIENLYIRVREMLKLLMSGIAHPREDLFNRALYIDDHINEYRKKVRKAHIVRLNKGACDVHSGILFLDMVTSFQKIGDYGFSVIKTTLQNKSSQSIRKIPLPDKKTGEGEAVTPIIDKHEMA